MSRFVIVALSGILVAPLLAESTPLAIRGVRYAAYDLAGGGVRPDAGLPTRFGEMVWGTTGSSAGFVPADYVRDWGDIRNGQAVGGFSFAYGTEVMLPTRLETTMLFYAEANGCDTPEPVLLASFILTDLPTGGPSWNTWLVTVDLAAQGLEFTIAGSDLDSDGLADFGYGYAFPPDALPTGPIIAAADPNEDPFPAPGIEDGWWIREAGGGELDCVMSPFGGNPFAQTFLLLYEPNDEGDCAYAGTSGKYCAADIDCGAHPCDCRVSLADLARLLSNYGTTSGAAYADGDLEPADGDGDVDLADLAELLSQYGDICE